MSRAKRRKQWEEDQDGKSRRNTGTRSGTNRSRNVWQEVEEVKDVEFRMKRQTKDEEAKFRLQKEMEDIKQEKETLQLETENMDKMEMEITAGIRNIRSWQLPPVSKKNAKLRASNQVLRNEVKQLIEDLEKASHNDKKPTFSKAIEEALALDRLEKIHALSYEMDQFDETMESLREMGFVSEEDSDSETKEEEDSTTTDHKGKTRKILV